MGAESYGCSTASVGDIGDGSLSRAEGNAARLLEHALEERLAL